MAVNRESLPHKVSSSEVPAESFRTVLHPLNSDYVRHSFSLGDACGLTKLGVHICRVAPHTVSSVAHWHANEDEWVYILEAGESGAFVITQAEGDAAPREEKAQKGDFFGFPAGKRVAHALRAGDHELVYLSSGSREVMDKCTYPSVGKTLIIDRTKGGSNFYVNESAKESR